MSLKDEADGLADMIKSLVAAVVAPLEKRIQSLEAAIERDLTPEDDLDDLDDDALDLSDNA